MLKTGPQLRQSSVKAAEHSGKQEQKVTGRTELRKSLSAKGPEFELMGHKLISREPAPMGVGFLGFFKRLPTSQWNTGEQMPALESDRPGQGRQLQPLANSPEASPSTSLSLGILQVSVGNNDSSLQASR